MLTENRLKELLSYDPVTGFFTRRIQVASNAPAGSLAGTRTKKGYIAIGIDGVVYLAHRLAWFYETGRWPVGVTDHIDTVKHHNWIANLQELPNKHNLQRKNTPYINNTSGFIGVHHRKDRLTHKKQYEAVIRANNKKQRLGYFTTAEEASIAYQQAKKQLHYSD